MIDIEHTKLADRIYAALLGSAIGDAMGGPVEGWSYTQIQETYGVVDRFLPYSAAPDYHNHFHTKAGAVTDDTRLRQLIARAIIQCGGYPRRGDIAQVIMSAYHHAKNDLERGFLEEYALSALYGEDKLIWGGQMTNGFIMANAPLGLICPCDPEKAFALSFAVDFISDGYAKYTAAMGAAAVAAVLRPQATPSSVVEDTLTACKDHRIEGRLTQQWQWYDHVFTVNERLISKAVEIALQYHDVFEVRELFYSALHISDLGSEAAQTLAVALGMWVAADGDLVQALVGCVNYGRDNDSYASVVGALAGAGLGTAAIPEDWSTSVSAANPEFDFQRVALDLASVANNLHQKQCGVMDEVAGLFCYGPGPGNTEKHS
ncbi:MAG: ADP-ribosylglycohydrolase family protein [Anaerolineales bacterium]|nr:MAG: ADP-ribosylglycohydrolase family protein [Anaerolineales bacterium]